MSRAQSRSTGRLHLAAGILTAVIAFTAAALPAQAIEIERVVSPGGIKAWLVRDTSVPLLSIEFSFRGGRTYDPVEKAGLSSLVSGLLDEGAGSLDSKSFQAELQNKSIRMRLRRRTRYVQGKLKSIEQTSR